MCMKKVMCRQVWRQTSATPLHHHKAFSFFRTLPLSSKITIYYFIHSFENCKELLHFEEVLSLDANLHLLYLFCILFSSFWVFSKPTLFLNPNQEKYNISSLLCIKGKKVLFLLHSFIHPIFLLWVFIKIGFWEVGVLYLYVVIMDLRRKGYLIFLLILVLAVAVKGENVVFNVKHKYGGRGGSILKELRAHDSRRHGRMLAAVDFELGGNGQPTDAALVPFV